MKKKFLTVILSLSMVLSMLIPVSGSASAEVSDKQMSRLVGLGIIKDMSSVEFKPENTVAKLTFYTSIYNFMTDEEETEGKIISLLKKYNIHIDEFTLRDSITREEALSAVVSMLGYTYRSVTGDELVTVANSFGVRKYVTGELSEYITLGETINLLDRALDTEMLTINIAFSTVFKYTSVSDVTPLMYYKEIHKVKGTVNKNSYASVVDNVPVPKGYVQIGDEEMLAGTTNAGDYLGMQVEAYVQYDEDDEGTIVYITPNEKNVIKLYADEILSVDDDIKSIEYELKDRVKTLKISSVVKVIYNGKNYGDYTKQDLMPDIGSLELIDSDNDNEIDVINVKNYKTVLVNYVSMYSETIVSKYGDPAAVVADGEEKEVIIEKDGAIIDISQIKPNDVLLVAESKTGSDDIVNILVSDKQEFGVIKEIDREEKELKVDDKVYNFSQAYMDAIDDEKITAATEILLAKRYTLYLDAFGNVAYAVCTDGKNYVYATRVWADDFEESYGIKFFDGEGVWQRVSFADNIKLNGNRITRTINGVNYKGDAAVYDYLSTMILDENGSPKFEPQLIRIEYNSDGEVKNIDIAENVKEPSETKFTKYTMDTARIYQPTGKTLGCDVYMEDDTKVFIVPSDKTNTDDYSVKTASYFLLDKWYLVDAYDIDDFYSTNIVVHQTDAKTVGTGRYYVSKKHKAYVEEEGEVRDVVNCIYGGTEVELIAADGWNFSNVNVGDIIRIATNARGEITYSEVYKKVTKNIVKEYPSLTDATKIHSSLAFAAGFVEKTNGEKGMLTVDCGNATPARFKQTGSTKYYLYDGYEKKKVKAISFSDIEPRDRVYVFIRYSQLEEVYVMRNVE